MLRDSKHIPIPPPPATVIDCLVLFPGVLNHTGLQLSRTGGLHKGHMEHPRLYSCTCLLVLRNQRAQVMSLQSMEPHGQVVPLTQTVDHRSA